jgi:hypothetical protein
MAMNEARPYASLSSGLLARKGTAKPAMRPQGYAGGFDDLGWNDMGHGRPESPEAPAPEHVPSSIAALTPAPRPDADFGEDLEEYFGETEDAEADAVEPEDYAAPVEARAEEAPVEDIEARSGQVEVPAEEIEAFAAEPLEPVPAPSVVAQQRAILERFDGEEDAHEEPVTAPARKRRAAKAEVVALPKRVASGGGRKSAFTLRLDVDRHLRLRLACAVTGRSAQQIVAGALDAALADIPEIDALAARAAGAKRN